MTKLPQLSRSSVNLTNRASICDIIDSRSKLDMDLLRDDINKRKAIISHYAEKSLEETKMMELIMSANPDPNIEPSVRAKAEASIIPTLAKMDIELASKGLSLIYYCNLFGRDILISLLNETIIYFTNQSRVKENLSPEDINALSIWLFAVHPHLRYSEILFGLNKALSGKYGTIYRLDRNVLMEWFNNLIDETVNYHTAIINSRKPEEKNVERVKQPVNEIDAFRTVQQEKKKIFDQIWKQESK